MALETRSSAILSFGTFEVDPRAGELCKQGKRIKLQDQPFQVLAVLLKRAGDVVTREELRSKIWPEDTFVDFDNSLNTAINKLREALGDSADSPRFIETLPRRGYRFLAPVTSDQQPKSAPAPLTRRILLAAVAVAVVAAAVFGGRLWRSGHGRVLTEKDTIVLGDFANFTGDTVFDGTLREGLSVQLEQSPFLSLVSEEGIHQTLRMMGQPANARLTPEITREVCQRTDTTTAVQGSIALIGSRYDLILKATNCANGALLASTEAQANGKNHVLDALSSAAAQMRSKLGESLSTVQRFNTPLQQATTSSLEALEAYSVGWNAVNLRGDFAASLPFFQRATELDPNFAMAYWATANAYVNMGESALAVKNAQKALELSTGLSEVERLIIEVDYCNTRGNLMKSRRSSEVGAQTYPREATFHWSLAFSSNTLGQYETGLEEYRESLRLAPYKTFFHRDVVFTYLLLNRIEDAVAAAKEAHTMGLDDSLVAVLYGIAFYRNDAAEMARQVTRAAGKPGPEDLLLALEADTAAYYGHFEKARESSHRAADSAKRVGKAETAATYHAVLALREALFGEADRARKQAMVAREYSTGRDADYGVALALAYANDVSRAHALADDLNRRFPEDTIMQVNYLPALRAKLALDHANPQEALDLLRPAAPYELGLPALGFYNWPNLYPVYVRGEAYLAAHQGREAAVEFQKILDHRGIVLNEPIGALAHLQLGRAYVLQGDTAKARAAYQDFLTLWKDSDSDIPILKQAKAEYAKLQ